MTRASRILDRVALGLRIGWALFILALLVQGFRDDALRTLRTFGLGVLGAAAAWIVLEHITWLGVRRRGPAPWNWRLLLPFDRRYDRWRPRRPGEVRVVLRDGGISEPVGLTYAGRFQGVHTWHGSYALPEGAEPREVRVASLPGRTAVSVMVDGVSNEASL